MLQGEELCDLGPANSNAPDASCRLDCRPQGCGDGIVDVGHGEQCDDANPTAGDGCSPQCFEEPPVGRIAGGGSKTTDCLLEFALDKHPLDLARSGRPNVKQRCRDGDPTCDRGSNPGECVFRVWLCARLNDPLLPACAPQGIGPVVETRVLKPSSADATRRVEDAETRQSLVGAATSFSGALEECGPRFEVRVPLNSKGRTGHKVIKLKVRAATGKVDPDTLKLDCLP